MATATRIAKQTAKTYQSVLLVHKKAQEKLDALLDSQAAYRLFEHDEKHPYYSQVTNAKRFVDEFEELAGTVLGVGVGSGTIGDELDKIQATLIVKGKDKDADIEALRCLPKTNERKIQANKLGEQVESVYGTATWIWSFCDLKATKAELEKQYDKKQVKRHLEVPYVKINVECRTAFKDVKKLAAMLLNLTVKRKSVREELDKRRTLLALKTSAPNQILDTLLRLKDK